MGRLDQPLELSDAATPLGNDFSGSLFEVRLDGPDTPSAVLKSFEPLGDPDATARLRQRLWRLGRLDRPELSGVDLGVTPAGVQALGKTGGQRLSDRPLLSYAEAFALLGHLAALTWACHQARIRGLRFRA